MLGPSDLELLSVADVCQRDLWSSAHANLLELRALLIEEGEKKRKRTEHQQHQTQVSVECVSVCV